MDVTVDMIKDLRQRTSAGIMDCKRALQDADGDMERAEELLRAKGLVDAAQRVGRETREGLVEAYVHTGGRLGALVEVSCETDFVARTTELKELAHDLAMQVAAMPSTSYIERSEAKEDETRPLEEVCPPRPVLHQRPVNYGDRSSAAGNSKGGGKHQGSAIRQVLSRRMRCRGCVDRISV